MRFRAAGSTCVLVRYRAFVIWLRFFHNESRICYARVSQKEIGSEFGIKRNTAQHVRNALYAKSRGEYIRFVEATRDYLSPFLENCSSAKFLDTTSVSSEVERQRLA